MFSAQKGATQEIQQQLEEGMRRIAILYRDSFPLGLDVAHMPGAGSAGGLSGGLVAATGALLKRGTDLVAEALGLEEAIRESDLVLTGEGRYDSQTVHGKTVSKVYTSWESCLHGQSDSPHLQGPTVGSPVQQASRDHMRIEEGHPNWQGFRTTNI